MFTGRQFDIETGLYYYRARYYSPDLGRFLQTDPIGYGNGINWYLYCGNNPVVQTDPFGMDEQSKWDVNPAIPEGMVGWCVVGSQKDIGLITYKLDNQDKTFFLEVTSWKEVENLINRVHSRGLRITFFEFVGHGTEGVGLVMGKDTFGIGSTDIDENWYGIDDYAPLLQSVFDPNAIIELEACGSADPSTALSIAKAFKQVLPNARVWGYTGDCQMWWSCWVWETHASWWDSDSRWIQVSSGHIRR